MAHVRIGDDPWYSIENTNQLFTLPTPAGITHHKCPTFILKAKQRIRSTFHNSGIRALLLRTCQRISQGS